MARFLRTVGAAAWLTCALVLYDLPRIPVASIPSDGPWEPMREAVASGLAIYFPSSLALLLLGGAVLRFARRVRSPEPGGSASSLSEHAGVAAAAFVLLSALPALAEGSRGSAALNVAWMFDAALAAVGACAAGWGASRALRARERARSPRLRLAALAGLTLLPPVLAGALLLAGGRSHPAASRGAAPDGQPPDILLIVADSLRADALSCYGGTGLPTPVLDELAARGARFSDVTAQAPSTIPSTATFLTSRHPEEHRAAGTRGRLSDGVKTLAEVLRSRGYETAGIVANPFVSREIGFDRGFDIWDQDPDPRPPARQPWLLSSRLRKALGWRPRLEAPATGEMVDRALRFLSRPGAAPRFLYLHLMDPHDPYAPPADLARAADPRYAGELSFLGGTLADILRGEVPFGEADLRHARALYGGEVAGVDRELERLFTAIEDKVASGRIVVAVTSDHGEEFMEHGSLGHGHSLYQEILRVPWILARPGVVAAGVVVSRPARLLDVAPTVLDVAGLPPEPSFAGRSLRPLLSGAEEDAPGGDVIYSAEDIVGTHTTTHHIRMARRENWKVILSSPNAFGVGPWRREAYDLAADPGEARSLAGGFPEADRLEAWLLDRIRAHPPATVNEERGDGDLDRRLKAAGYFQ